MFITYKNNRFEVEMVKFAKTNNVRIYLFKNMNKAQVLNPYIVAASDCSETLVFSNHVSIKCAVQQYLELLFKYA